jgi:hypothetical protein
VSLLLALTVGVLAGFVEQSLVSGAISAFVFLGFIGFMVVLSGQQAKRPPLNSQNDHVESGWWSKMAAGMRYRRVLPLFKRPEYRSRVPYILLALPAAAIAFVITINLLVTVAVFAATALLLLSLQRWSLKRNPPP